MTSLPKQQLIDQLLDYLNALHPTSNGYAQQLEKSIVPMMVRKNKYILSPVDNNTYLFFICKGLVRGFVKDGNKDITTWISLGNEFVGAIRNPLREINSSIEYLQALEDCDLLAIPYAVIDQLYEKYPEANIIGRKVLSMLYHAAAERSILARIPSGQKRYNRFIEMSKLDSNRIPLRCIASYLGMRLETLSRIRNKEPKAGKA